MAIKKSELYSALWASCDELRGGMEPSEYKNYVLAVLFVKYISDKYAGKPYSPVTVPEGATWQDMIALKGTSDIGDKINKKIMEPIAAANQLSGMPDFGDPAKLGEEKDQVERLTNLIAIFEDPKLDFSKNRADGDDLLGDAYEYLMRHFATESGKSKGQFYTPSEVSRIMAQIIGITPENSTSETSVYDPTCGSGSLLLKIGAQTGKSISLFGQEKESTTAGLARMNFILHDNPSAKILSGNTLANPKYLNKDGGLNTFDYVVANPPFSDKRWGNGVDPDNDKYGRFEHYGVPPAKNGDFAYLLHIIKSLKSKGKGACILPHGVLFRGNAEAEIRKNLIRRGFIKGIIGLPANLFYGTGIPACIILIDKEDAHIRKGIFMIDASKGFIKDGPKNRLREQDIHKIVDVFNRQEEIDKFSGMVAVSQIEANDFNLNIPRYIDTQEPEDIQDIEAHLLGGIPKGEIDDLNEYWKVYPTLKTTLFSLSSRDGYMDLKVAKADIRQSIFEHPEFTAYGEQMDQVFQDWENRTTEHLKALEPGYSPKTLIEEISEDLLHQYEGKALIDNYSVYQHLMDFWNETMQDDCYIVSGDGWKAETYRILVKNKKGKEVDKGWTCDLIPSEYVVNRYFIAEKKTIEQLEADRDAATAELAELKDGFGGEDGALFEVSSKADVIKAMEEYYRLAWEAYFPGEFQAYVAAGNALDTAIAKLMDLEVELFGLKNSKGKVTAKAVNDRLNEIGESDPSEAEALNAHQEQAKAIALCKKKLKEAESKLVKVSEIDMEENPTKEFYAEIWTLQEYWDWMEKESDLKKQIKEAEKELDDLAYAKYPQLTETEIKQLVVDDKWMARIEADLKSELDRISQRLGNRLKELIERYEFSLPEISASVSELEAKVNGHLEKMGFAWK